jgi:Uncharacterized membrane protein, putative virulence factor
VLAKALTPGFFAREDTRTPFRLAMISLGCNIALSITLFQFLNYAGIALATALASWLNVAMLSWKLHRRGHLRVDAQLLRNLTKALLCSLVMGVACGPAPGRWRRLSPDRCGQDRRPHASGRRRAGGFLRPGAGDPCRQRRGAEADGEAGLALKRPKIILSLARALVRPLDRARSYPAPNPL